MYCRLVSSKRPDGFILSLVLVTLLALTGCAPVQESGPSTIPLPAPAAGPVAEVVGAKALKDAQGKFDEASKQLLPGGAIPAEARSKYQDVVNIVENQVLQQVTRDDLKVTAYALEAFSQWQLGDHVSAVKTADRGKKLCRGAASNPRDCAMLQMVGGLVVASQTYDTYKNAPVMSQEEVRSFANRMEAALHEINAVNQVSNPKEPITIYANQWQLMIIRQASNFWYTYVRQDAGVWKPEVLKWLRRSDQVLQKFPEPPYPNQDLTLRLKEEFARLKNKAEAP